MSITTELARLCKEQRDASVAKLLSEAAALKLEVVREQVLVYDSEQISICMGPLATDLSKSGIAFLVSCEPRRGQFDAGLYLVSVGSSGDEMAEDAEWKPLKGGAARVTKFWYMSTPKPGSATRVTINSREERMLTNGTISIFIDGTINLNGIEAHFFLYIF